MITTDQKYNLGFNLGHLSFNSLTNLKGFQGQEKDDELKGEGNSVNYKYRMHDPRIGRFFAVDPLSSKFPYNSPYAFSENSVVACRELEGLEAYFSADGSYLGMLGESTTMMVVQVNDVAKFNEFKAKNETNKTPAVFAQSQLFHAASETAQKNITNTIYSQAMTNGGKLTSVSIGENGFNGSKGMSVNKGTKDLTIYPDLVDGGEYILDDFWNFTNLLFHEMEHMAGTGADGFSHFEIAKKQIQEPGFESMTKAGKDYVRGVAKGYLMEQASHLTKELFFAGDKAEEVYNSYDFQYRLKEYNSNIDFYNKTFDSDMSKRDFEKIKNESIPKK